MRAAERHRTAAELRRRVDDADALRVEQEPAVDVLQAVRQREVAQAAVRDRRVAGEDRVVERPAHLSRAATALPALRIVR